MGNVTIAVHDGGFHADEIFAVAVIFLVLGDSVDVSVVRTRDIDIINKADYALDVGGVYDESKNRFDHHQIGGAGERENSIPYASFGLVWKRYGKQICGSDEVANKIDKKVVQPVDAIDNGVEIIKPVFEGVYPYNFYDFIDAFYPSWKEDYGKTDEIFLGLVPYAKKLLEREISKTKDELEANLIVEEIYNKTNDKRLIIFDRYYPSNGVLSTHPEPLFIVYPREGGDWALKTIRDNEDSFINRKNLPQNWAGRRDGEFEKITGVIGSIFCHRDCFLATAKTKEAALQLAEIALKN